MTHSGLTPSVGVIIATRNRPLELQRVISALAEQTLVPNHVAN